MHKKLRMALNILFLAAICGLPALATNPISSSESVTGGPRDKTLAKPEVLPRLKLDCSHLVHAVYGSLGLNYQYATSRTLYGGVHAFRSVSQPECGDLVVWRGHVGIVVDPARHRFISALRSGVKTASYFSKYWRRYGRPRFFQYALSDKVNTSREELAQALTSITSHGPIPSAD
jgi:hypothetical protein